MYVLPKLRGLDRPALSCLFSALLPEEQQNINRELNKTIKLHAALFKTTANKRAAYCELDRRSFYLGSVPSIVKKNIIPVNKKCDQRRGPCGKYCDHKFDYTVRACLRQCRSS
jgi:hypothetical protein